MSPTPPPGRRRSRTAAHATRSRRGGSVVAGAGRLLVPSAVTRPRRGGPDIAGAGYLLTPPTVTRLYRGGPVVAGAGALAHATRCGQAASGAGHLLIPPTAIRPRRGGSLVAGAGRSHPPTGGHPVAPLRPARCGCGALAHPAAGHPPRPGGCGAGRQTARRTRGVQRLRAASSARPVRLDSRRRHRRGRVAGGGGPPSLRRQAVRCAELVHRLLVVRLARAEHRRREVRVVR